MEERLLAISFFGVLSDLTSFKFFFVSFLLLSSLLIALAFPFLALGSTLLSFSLLSLGLFTGGFGSGFFLASTLVSLSLVSLLSVFTSFLGIFCFSLVVCSNFSGFSAFSGFSDFSGFLDLIVLFVTGSVFFLGGTTDLLSESPFLIVLDLLSLLFIDLDLDFSSSFLAVLFSLIVFDTETDSLGLFLDTAGLPLTSLASLPLTSLDSLTSFGFSSFISTGLGFPASMISSLNLSTKI
ncbi:MAG: hypothetical protein ACK5YA_00435 [bacterium]